MAKVSSKANQPSKQEQAEQDQKDQATFFKWMLGVTGLLVLALYYVFSNAL